MPLMEVSVVEPSEVGNDPYDSLAFYKEPSALMPTLS